VAEEPVTQYEGTPDQAGGDVVEYSPEAAAAAMAEVEEAQATADTLLPGDDLLKARDELLGRLAGLQAAAVGEATPGRFGPENFEAVGVGLRQANGIYTGELAVKVYVTEKAPQSKLEAAAVVPQEIDGIPVDVEETGELHAFVYRARYRRPVPCGVSCGHVRITAGTIGCLVVLDNNRLCLLSNNHVLANENAAQPGDAIVQPGPIDGGRDPGDRIGVLERFIPIHFPGPNRVDCAAAWTAFRLVKPQHVTYRMNPDPLAPSLGMSVIKNGRTTQATLGMITDIAASGVRVRYSAAVARFDEQIIVRGIGTRPFSQGGDSGSVIVSAGSKRPVGLLFAGSATHTIANRIIDVKASLAIRRFVGG
jgi:hypothetical protein